LWANITQNVTKFKNVFVSTFLAKLQLKRRIFKVLSKTGFSGYAKPMPE